jgi:hypothetical protein
MKRFLLPAALLSLALLAAACGRRSATPVLGEGDFLLPSATVPETDPLYYPATADHVRLLVFIHPQDPVCLDILRNAFSAIQRDYADRGFALTAVIPTVQTHPPVLPEIAALDFPFPVAYADPATVEHFGGPSAVRAIPTAFLYAPGTPAPARSYSGYPDISRLRADIEALLDGKPLPPPQPLFLPEENPA